MMQTIEIVHSSTKVAGGIMHAVAQTSMVYVDGVNWYTRKGYYYSLKFTEMKVKQ